MATVAILGGLVVLGLLLALALRARSRELLGPIDLQVTRPRLAMGQRFGYTLTLRPTGRLHVNAIRLAFEGYEWIKWTETRHDTDSRGRRRTRRVTHTRTHTLHAEVEELAGARELGPGTPFERSGELRVPNDGPPSFSTPHNAVRWHLQLSFDIRGLPDIEETYDLWVRPVQRAETADDDV